MIIECVVLFESLFEFGSVWLRIRSLPRFLNQYLLFARGAGAALSDQLGFHQILLSAVAIFASGGFKALSAAGDKTSLALLEQLKP